MRLEADDAGISGTVGVSVIDDGASTWLDVSPEIAGASREQDPYPRVTPSPFFWLVFITDRWDVMEGSAGARVVPQLYRLSATPGANGVARGAGGRPDVADAFAMTERSGHVILPWDIDGPNTSYLRPFQVGMAQDRRSGGPVKILSWHTRWEQLYAGSDQVDSDTVGYVDWLASLVDGGKIPRPRPYVLERLSRFYEQAVTKRIGRDGGRETEKSAMLRARLQAVLREQIERMTPKGPPVAPEVAAPEVATRASTKRRKAAVMPESEPPDDA